MTKIVLLKWVLGTTLIFAFFPVKAQDTINKTNGEKIIGKVLLIDNSTVRYKKSSNPDGPEYVIHISEISYIRYQNNEIEAFKNQRAVKEDKYQGLRKDEILNDMTKKGNKVYIESKDENSVLHAKNGLEKWGYWVVTNKKEEADFILRFDYVFGGLGDTFGRALFINPQNGEVLLKTKEVNTMMSMDMNTKRGLINKLINNEIRPFFK
ncbi:MAG TPA: hypothetical protein VK179_05205 [Bacteroidales bacterium]|nr:hypothetical protein [Bacteroidales bacterium]